MLEYNLMKTGKNTSTAANELKLISSQHFEFNDHVLCIILV